MHNRRTFIKGGLGAAAIGLLRRNGLGLGRPGCVPAGGLPLGATAPFAQIPASPEYPSLNLAMAVQVVCYELFKQAGGGEVVTRDWDRPLASMAQVEELIEHLESVLVSSSFLDADNPGQTMTRLRRLLTRLRPDVTEVQMLRGVLSHLDGKKDRGNGEGE